MQTAGNNNNMKATKSSSRVYAPTKLQISPSDDAFEPPSEVDHGR